MSGTVGAPWWAGLRAVPLALFAAPLVPALFLALAGGNGRIVGGCVAGLAGIGLATARLRRARRRDARRAAALLGIGTGLAAGLAGGTGAIGGVVLGMMAFIGARMLYEGARHAGPDDWAVVRDGLHRGWDALRTRRAGQADLRVDIHPPAGATGDPLRDRVVALRFADARLLSAVDALDRLRAEVVLRPQEGVEARRVLMLGLDGLERIAGRLKDGAAPPADLPATLGDLARAADDAAHGLRAAETEALEIQVKVLRDRLREEGRA